MGDLKFKVAVSTGLYTIARAEELATLVRKIGYALTRGTSAIEVAADVPHEINFTDGQELRYIARKQVIDLNFHGSLTIPFTIPEMVQWKEAEDHTHKSIKSAVYGGCKYIDFHSCLHFWLEMLTYTGSRLEIMMADWKGRFISEILFENKKTRDYFIEEFWEKYDRAILGEEATTLYYKAEAEIEAERNEFMQKMNEEIRTHPERRAEFEEKMRKYREEEAEKHRRKLGKLIRKTLEEKMSSDDIKRREWFFLGKERGDYLDACEIIAHYLFYTKDPIWTDMVKFYEKELEGWVKEFGPIDPDTNGDWLKNVLKKNEERGDRFLKEFFYGAVAAKMLQGHLVSLARWMHEKKEFKGRGLPSIISNELKIIKPKNLEKEKKELMDVLKNLKIAIETPDARDPSYAGRYMLWRAKQIYVAIKHTREALKKEGNPHWDKFMLLIDFEHIAGQGVDPIEELTKLTELVPDVGKYIVCVHSNRPTTYHSHFPLELGDDLVYKLLWILTKAGMGKDQTTYILFERGGFKDPFKQAVTTLRLIVRFLKKGTHPDDLPPEFYGIYPKGLLAEERQWVTIYHHMMDPLKGTLKIPEEEYTAMSKAAIEEGKKPEEFKKEEFR